MKFVGNKILNAVDFYFFLSLSAFIKQNRRLIKTDIFIICDDNYVRRAESAIWSLFKCRLPHQTLYNNRLTIKHDGMLTKWT